MVGRDRADAGTSFDTKRGRVVGGDGRSFSSRLTCHDIQNWRLRDMSGYSQDRRDFIKLALATSSLSFAPSLGWAFGSEEERTTWYRNAKFGMFIHWGPYSLASVEASWPIMRPTAGGITVPTTSGHCRPRYVPLGRALRSRSSAVILIPCGG